MIAITERAPPAPAGRPGAAPGNLMPPRVVKPDSPPYVVDVSRPEMPWRWSALLQVPIEVLALAWSVPFLILLVLLPIGLAVASALWLGRWILGM